LEIHDKQETVIVGTGGQLMMIEVYILLSPGVISFKFPLLHSVIFNLVTLIMLITGSKKNKI